MTPPGRSLCDRVEHGLPVEQLLTDRVTCTRRPGCSGVGEDDERRRTFLVDVSAPCCGGANSEGAKSRGIHRSR